MTQTFFVTGTDTDIGKTVATIALLQAVAKQGDRCVGYKPIASGSEMTTEGLRNDDALALLENSNLALSYSQVNPFTYQVPTSPHIAAAITKVLIDEAVLSAGLAALKNKADWIFIEGAGGWHTPLSMTRQLCDWVYDQQCDVILVVGMKLGCINHALLTLNAIRQKGLKVVGWIANDIEPKGKHHQQYRAYLDEKIDAPFLGEIPYLEQWQETEQKSDKFGVKSSALGDFLNIQPLQRSI